MSNFIPCLTRHMIKSKLGLKLIHVCKRGRAPCCVINALQLVNVPVSRAFIHLAWFNTLRPRQNGRRFADDTFKCIFLNENVRISIKISLKFVPKGPINNNPAVVQIMAWRLSCDKPLSEPMMVNLLTHICVTWPQWVKHTWHQNGLKHCISFQFHLFFSLTI